MVQAWGGQVTAWPSPEVPRRQLPHLCCSRGVTAAREAWCRAGGAQGLGVRTTSRAPHSFQTARRLKSFSRGSGGLGGSPVPSGWALGPFHTMSPPSPKSPVGPSLSLTARSHQ